MGMGNKVAYVQFLEDSYGTAGSFKTGGTTRFHGDPSGKEVEVYPWTTNQIKKNDMTTLL
jgi:hypothetical protein